MTGEPKVSSRLFRGYGPLVGLILTLVIVANFLPTQRQKVVTDVAGESASRLAVGGSDEDTTTTVVDGASTTVDPAAAAAAAAASAAAGGAASGAAKAGPRSNVAAGKASSDAAAGRVPCADRKIQVPADPYSPNCFTWTGGDNGGATWTGVSATTVKVTVRISAFLDGLNNALSKAAGAKELAESPEMVKRTFTGLTKYLNDHYQFYGRKIDLVIVDGKGNILDEALGAGQEGAQQDARSVAKDIGAFADASAVTVPYADALTQQKVVNIGAPYVSKDWLVAHRPYSWTPLTDGSTVVSAVASYYINKMAGKNATWAGGDLAGKPRRAAIVAPDNSWYQESVAAGVRVLNQSGHGSDLVANVQYKLDLNAMSTQAASILPKLKQSGATTVLCGCDPVLLSFLTAQAKQQQYFPEWVETGVAYTDQDLVGQLFEPSVWQHTFGVSFAGSTVPLKGSFAYQAYKSSGTPGEPSIAAQIIFDQLQLLAIGIQMAGPVLNPTTFEAGMFAYLPRSGVSGRWDFGPGDYSTSSDAREIYWDPKMTSIQNGKQGGWRESPVPRVPIGQWPAGDPDVPRP